MSTKLISIVTGTYNEEENIVNLYNRIKNVIKDILNYKFEILFIDNASTDQTVPILKKLAEKDKNLKIIVNVRNFGHIRSPYWGMLQAQGDAIIYLASDLQDPPELITNFIKEWEKGFKIALGIKNESKVNFFLHTLRKQYYNFFNKISKIKIIKNSTGFGIYDKEVIDHIRKINDPYPFFRGIIAELGYEVKQIPFVQNNRIAGVTKNNFFTLYDILILSIVKHSITPIRIVSLLGFLIGFTSIIFAIIFIVLKLIYWNSFPVGISPIIIVMFFMFGLILLFIGLIGEYVASINNYLQKIPIVVEKERINF